MDTICSIRHTEDTFSEMRILLPLKSGLLLLLKNVRVGYSETKRPLMINGMIKTGKTCFLTEILPNLICQSPDFGADSQNPALIWHVSCDQNCHTNYTMFMKSICFDFMRFAADNSLDLRMFPFDQKSAEDYQMNLLQWLRSSKKTKTHVFMLIDEVQEFFSWFDSSGEMNVEAVQSMQRYFKSLVCCQASRYFHVAVTGSALAGALVNIFQMRANGTIVPNAFIYIDLPARVKEEAMEAVVESHVKKGRVCKYAITEIAGYAECNPALFTILVEGYKDSLQITKEQLAIYCRKTTLSKATKELWTDTGYYLKILTNRERNIIRSLVVSGITEDEFDDFALRAWKKHLESYVRQVDGNLLLLDCSKILVEFIQVHILDSGELAKDPQAMLQRLQSSYLFPRFQVVMANFGEACKKYRDRSIYLPQSPLAGVQKDCSRC
eukprot:m.131616 g.131616  ORF g.131616 m.131616 type:complete len:438 (+) comp38044_c0_seq1:285-1598(+)